MKPSYHFSYQELRIIQLVKEGNSNDQIADSLSIAVTTVKSHRRNILKKIGAKGKTAFWAFVFSFPDGFN